MAATCNMKKRTCWLSGTLDWQDLPRPNVSSTFIFAKEDVFLCYPNNYNHYVNYYRNTFQHGGISLEEMIVPVIRMQSK